MYRRLRRVVPILLALTAGTLAAADGVVEIHGAGSGTTLQIAFDELQLDIGEARSPVDPHGADARIRRLRYAKDGSAVAAITPVASTAELAAVGRRLVAAGAAHSFSAVAYPRGATKPELRTVISKRITLGYNGDPDTLAQRHGCRVESLLFTGVWTLVATGDDPLAGVTAAAALAKEAGVRFAEPQLLRRPRALHSPDDPLYNAYTPPAPYYPAWWTSHIPPLYAVPPWSPTSDIAFNPQVKPVGSTAVTLELIGPIPPPDDPQPLSVDTPNPGDPGASGVYWSQNPLPGGTDHGQWHLHANAGMLNCEPVWSQFTGDKIAVTVVDTGLEYTHPDLKQYPIGNVEDQLSLNIVNPGASVLATATGTEDSHSTSVSGTIAAMANGIGGVGVSYDAKIIPIKFLPSFDDKPGSYPGYVDVRDDADYAKTVTWRVKGTGQIDTTSISNNSWGYGGINSIAPSSAGLAALQYAMDNGRFRRGIIFVFAAGNDNGSETDVYNTIHPYDNATYDGFINRYTIGVGALNRAGAKTQYSEIGPNLLVSAPGGELGGFYPRWAAVFIPGLSPFSVRGGMVTTDRVGANGFELGVANTYLPTGPAIWSGDYTLVHPGGDPYCTTNGQGELAGTSFAAPDTAGVIALMLEARPELTWRDVQSVLLRRAGKPPGALVNNANPTSPEAFTTIPGNLIDSATPPFYAIPPGLTYGAWFTNNGGAGPGTGLTYNLWYGFGSVDAVKAVYGMGASGAGGATPDVDPANADLDEATQLTTFGMRYDNPGALHTPLLPAEAIPLTASFVRDGLLTDHTDPLSGFIPFGLGHFTEAGHRLVETFAIDTSTQPGFVTETVEMHVVTSLVARGHLTFVVESPSGTIIHVPQRGIDTTTDLNYTFTLQGFRDEDPDGTWKLFVIDSMSTGDPQGLLNRADLTIHGHLPYPRPHAGAATIGVAAGTSSKVQMDGTGFARNANAEVTTTVGAWYDIPANLGTPVTDVATATVIYRLTANAVTSTKLELTIPASLADPAMSPGDAIIEIGNPALPFGQNSDDTTDSVGNTFSSDAWEAFDAAITYTGPVAGEKQRLKLDGGGTPHQIVCHYSRPPSITPMADLLLPAGTPPGTTFSRTFTVDDPDIASPNTGIGRASTDESLTIVTQVFNQSTVANSSLSAVIAAPFPAGQGTGTYTLTGTVSGTSGLSLVQVGVTDGVTTTYTAFRVGVLAEDDASGCGGGMGLALIGMPLAAWLLRRRRR